MLGLFRRLGSWKVFYVITYALFLDYFIYGLVVPLTAYSPAQVSGHEQLALLYGGYALGVFVATPVFGLLGNQIGGKRIVILGVLLSLTATLLFWFGDTFPLVLLARLCQGGASAATWTAGLALIAERYVKNRVQMMGLAIAGSTAGAVLGPVAGGFLHQAGGYALPFVLLVVLVGIDTVQRIFLLPNKVTYRGSNAELFALLADKSVLVPGLAVALAAFGWGIVEPLLPEHLSRSEASPSAIGMMFTISTIAFGLITPVVSRVATRAPIKIVISGGTLAMAITLPLLGLLPGIILTGFGLCLVSMSFAFMLNPTSAELGNAVDRRGLRCYTAVYAVYNITYSIGMMASNAVATAAGHLQFYQTLLCVSAVLVLSLPILIKGTPAPASEALANGNSEKPAKTI